MTSRRNRCNLEQPQPPEPRLMEAQERRSYLGMLALFRLLDLYFWGMQE